MGFTEDDLGKTFEKTKSKKTEKLDTTKYLNYFQFSCFRFFSYWGLKFLKRDLIDYRVVRWKVEHNIGLTDMEMFLAKIDLTKLKERKVYFIDYVSKWGTSLLDTDYLSKNEFTISIYASKFNNEIQRGKRYLKLSVFIFCVSVLMLGYSIGRLSSSSSNAEADGFQTEVTAEGNVYVSDSPGSKRYHKDRNCPALKRTTGKITATDEANAIDQGKTLCGWCGK